MLKLTESRNLNAISKEYPRMSIGPIMSESYRLLYDCSNPRVKKLIEAHIQGMKQLSSREVQSNLSKLSENTHILRNLVNLGRKAKISEGELAQIDADEELRDESRTEDTDELDDRDVLEGQPDEDHPDSDMDPATTDDKENLLEDIRKRRARKRESAKVQEVDEKMKRTRTPGTLPHVVDVDECDYKKKNESWSAHRNKMIPALKNFRESSNNKAFYKTLSRMQGSLLRGKTLSVKESITLYKAINSAMTHLAVELEHNPGFIYTFNECTNLLSRDTANLLKFIREGKSPSKPLMRSIASFSKVLMNEEEDYEDFDFELEDIPGEDEAVEEGIPSDSVVVTPEGEEIPFEDVSISDLDIDIEDVAEYVSDEVEDAGLSGEAEELDISDVTEEEAEELADYLIALRKADGGSEEEEMEDESSPEEDGEVVLTDEEGDEITAEEFESLKTKLGEMRKIRKMREARAARNRRKVESRKVGKPAPKSKR